MAEEGWIEFEGLVEPLDWGRSTYTILRLDARPGDVVLCRLRPADPDLVPLPAEVAEALTAADCLDAFEARPAPERRRLLHPVEEARTADTRARRIRALVAALTS